jgi:hypothetical protein
MEQLILHLVGDYVLQSDWMAAEKTKRSWPCLAHVLVYTLPFLLVTSSPWALGMILSTHFLLDRFRLIRYMLWLKNMLGSAEYRRPWSECTGTGYPSEKPAWLAVWLMIVADNAVHLAINYAAIRWL